jgi:hypothetical protein
MKMDDRDDNQLSLDPVVGGLAGVEEPVCGMFVSSACNIFEVGFEVDMTKVVTWTGVKIAADGAIRMGIESSVG